MIDETYIRQAWCGNCQKLATITKIATSSKVKGSPMTGDIHAAICKCLLDCGHDGQYVMSQYNIAVVKARFSGN